MSTPVGVRVVTERPAGHRAVPLLVEPRVGHYPEFRAHLVAAFGLAVTPGADAPLGEPGLLEVDGRVYELVFLGRSGEAFPAGVELNALVPGLEPTDDAVVDADVWALLEWLVAGAGWSVDELRTTGSIYRVPGSGGPRRD